VLGGNAQRLINKNSKIINLEHRYTFGAIKHKLSFSKLVYKVTSYSTDAADSTLLYGISL
jgi:hypothetical protein